MRVGRFANSTPRVTRASRQCLFQRKAPDVRSRVLVVRVVVVPPLVRRGLRVALGRVLPLLLASERGDVEIAPGGAKLRVAASVDEIGAEDPIALTDEGVVPVPLVHAEILVEVVCERVPRDEFPAHALLQALDLGLWG